MVTIAVGQTYERKLDLDPSGGYFWSVSRADSKVLSYSKKTTVGSGSNTKNVFYFKGLKEGISTIHFSYHQKVSNTTNRFIKYAPVTVTVVAPDPKTFTPPTPEPPTPAPPTSAPPTQAPTPKGSNIKQELAFNWNDWNYYNRYDQCSRGIVLGAITMQEVYEKFLNMSEAAETAVYNPDLLENVAAGGKMITMYSFTDEGDTYAAWLYRDGAEYCLHYTINWGEPDGVLMIFCFSTDTFMLQQVVTGSTVRVYS